MFFNRLQRYFTCITTVFLCFYGGRIHVFFCIKKQVLAAYKITMKILGLTFWLHCLLLTGCSCLSLNVSYKCINY